MGSSENDITLLLERVAGGDEAAVGELMPLVYEELRGLAARFFLRQANDHTLQPTALVHELFVRLVRQDGTEWRGREHFMAVAATAMRQILTDHARRRRARKRGGDWAQVTLSGVGADPDAWTTIDVVALDDVLTRLEQLDARHAKLVVYRVFGGLTVEEAARALDVSPRTVNNDWRFVKAWLSRELRR